MTLYVKKKNGLEAKLYFVFSKFRYRLTVKVTHNYCLC